MAIIYKEANPGNFKRGRNDNIKYIVIHYTANNGDTAKGNANYFCGTVTQTSAHYFVDEGSDIWQTVKDCDTAWHCGTAGKYLHPLCRNDNSLGIELCSRKDGNYYFKSETVSQAVALTKELMAKYNIPVANVVRHHDVTGKQCPAPFVESAEQWNDFLYRLTASEETPETAGGSHAGGNGAEEIAVSVSERSVDRTIGRTGGGDIISFDLLSLGIHGIQGFNIEGTIYVGVRELLEALGYLVGWDDIAKTVLVRNKTLMEVSAEDQAILEKIVEAEAGGEDELGKILVADVILNRVLSPYFPDSIESVVFQPNQFEPIRNGAYAAAKPSGSTVDAVQYALRGENYSKGALFFRSIAGVTPDCWHECTLNRLFDHGGHRFYNVKE